MHKLQEYNVNNEKCIEGYHEKIVNWFTHSLNQSLHRLHYRTYYLRTILPG